MTLGNSRSVAMFLDIRFLKSALDMLLNIISGITHWGQCRWTSVRGNERGILIVRIRCSLSDGWMPRVFELHRQPARQLDSTRRMHASRFPVLCDGTQSGSHTLASILNTWNDEYDVIECDGQPAMETTKCRAIVSLRFSRDIKYQPIPMSGESFYSVQSV